MWNLDKHKCLLMTKFTLGVPKSLESFSSANYQTLLTEL